MKLRLAIFCLGMVLGHPALAQYGVSNQRDAYGNLVRSSGSSSPGSVNQSMPNNGAIRNTPAQQPTNPGTPQKIQPYSRSGGGVN
jgi:hypothetical protein